MINTNFKFHDKFIFRTPLYPIKEALDKKNAISQFINQKNFKEAIYLASPSLHKRIEQFTSNTKLFQNEDVEKLNRSISNYYNRMCTRCTPFGIFAQCSVGNWDKKTSLIVGKSYKKTRLDMSFTCSLAQMLSLQPIVQKNILFFPNNSIYSFGNEIRYIQYKYTDGIREHEIAKVDQSLYLERILNESHDGANISYLSQCLISMGITEKEATGFIEQLISYQLLVSEIEPAVTGKNHEEQLVSILEELSHKDNDSEVINIYSLFKKAIEHIRHLDESIGNDIKEYKKIYHLLNKIKVPIKEKYLFQVDTYNKFSESTLNNNIKLKLSTGINFLQKICMPYQREELNNFKLKFIERYEGREIPVNIAMDSESGIGYPIKNVKGINPLIDDILLQNENNQLKILWNKREDFLLQKLIEATKSKKYSINFFDEEIENIHNNKNKSLPVSFSIIFKIIDDKTEKIFFKSAAGGSSAANLLGRFAHGNNDIMELLKDITNYEQQIYEDKILAEITHLPGDRVGNILARPVLRGYEIPYLSRSGCELKNQIPINDLLISISNNRIVLRSKKLNAEIIPRLSTAHNFSINALPIYRFLCDLQFQDISSAALTFNWGTMAKSFPFLPRAIYKDIIFFPATWNISKSNISELINSQDDNLISVTREWRNRLNIPKLAVLKEGDKELLVDFDSKLSVKSFIKSSTNKHSVQLSEFLFSKNSGTVNKKGESFTNEIIATAFNDKFINPDSNFVNHYRNSKRNFIIGNKWMYYKIYCGIEIADSILSNTIYPLITVLNQKELIEKWFFIRYNDPKSHIRLRLLSINKADLTKIISIAFEHFNPLVNNGIIHQILTDTYVQELERYGEKTINLAEDYFKVDSEFVLDILSLSRNISNGEEIKLQAALKSIDDLLNSFHYSLKEKKRLTKTLKTSFINEHNNSKSLRSQLSSKFRNHRPTINKTLSKSPIYLTNEIVPILNRRDNGIKRIAKIIISLKSKHTLEVSLDNLISSYIHMGINRLYKDRQRTCEMVIYDLLYRHYESSIAQKKYAN